MRATVSLFRRFGAGLALGLCLALCAPAAHAAAKQQKAAEPQGEPVEINGRVVAGLDKVFIKDAEGYCLVQGVDLSPYSGRHIAAKALVIRKDQEYRTVRLLEYRIQSPDDDSPGAGGAVQQTAGTGKKKK
jgi:hypothetical protein